MGVLLVASAGNNASSELWYPASYKNVVAIAAVNEAMQRAWFSNYNKEVDVAASGVEVLSTVPTGSRELVAYVSAGSSSFMGKFFAYLATPDPDIIIAGTLVNCSELGPDGQIPRD